MLIVKRPLIDKIATGGLFITAIFSPCCFPLYGFVFSALGLGSVELFGGITWYVFMGFVAISVLGQYWSFLRHRNVVPFGLALFSSLLIIGSYYFLFSFPVIYTGMFGLMAATIVNHFAKRKTGSCPACVPSKPLSVLVFQSVITCPECGSTKKEIMPHDSCQYFYECEGCRKILKPLVGDCCVYCSYGSVKCPPIQAGEKCC